MSSQGGRLMSFRLKKSQGDRRHRQSALPDGTARRTAADGNGGGARRATDRRQRCQLRHRGAGKSRSLRKTPAVVIFTATTKDEIKLDQDLRHSAIRATSSISRRRMARSADRALTEIGLTMSQPMTALPGYRDYPDAPIRRQGEGPERKREGGDQRGRAGQRADHLRGFRRSLLPVGVHAAEADRRHASRWATGATRRTR